MDGSGSMVTLGGFNSIFNPVTSQGRLDYYSYGGFRENWWNNDSHIPHYNGSYFDNLDELQADSVGCSELGKRGVRDAGAYARELIAWHRGRGRSAGRHSFDFDAGALSSGTYIAVLRGTSSVSAMPLLLAK